MSSISVSDLKSILENYPDDYEVVMNIKHKYPISKKEGLRGWYAYINGVKVDDDFREIRLMNQEKFMKLLEKYSCIFCKYRKLNKNHDYACMDSWEKDESGYPIGKCNSLSNIYYGKIVELFPFKQID